MELYTHVKSMYATSAFKESLLACKRNCSNVVGISIAGRKGSAMSFRR